MLMQNVGAGGAIKVHRGIGSEDPDVFQIVPFQEERQPEIRLGS